MLQETEEQKETDKKRNRNGYKNLHHFPTVLFSSGVHSLNKMQTVVILARMEDVKVYLARH